jgi:hypothetical protein
MVNIARLADKVVGTLIAVFNNATSWVKMVVGSAVWVVTADPVVVSVVVREMPNAFAATNVTSIDQPLYLAWSSSAINEACFCRLNVIISIFRLSNVNLSSCIIYS